MTNYFLEVDIQYLKNLYELHYDLSFSPERMKIKIVKSLYIIYMIKLNTLYTLET